MQLVAQTRQSVRHVRLAAVAAAAAAAATVASAAAVVAAVGFGELGHAIFVYILSFASLDDYGVPIRFREWDL